MLPFHISFLFHFPWQSIYSSKLYPFKASKRWGKFWALYFEIEKDVFFLVLHTWKDEKTYFSIFFSLLLTEESLDILILHNGKIKQRKNKPRKLISCPCQTWSSRCFTQGLRIPYYFPPQRRLSSILKITKTKRKSKNDVLKEYVCPLFNSQLIFW